MTKVLARTILVAFAVVVLYVIGDAVMHEPVLQVIVVFLAMMGALAWALANCC